MSTNEQIGYSAKGSDTGSASGSIAKASTKTGDVAIDVATDRAKDMAKIREKIRARIRARIRVRVSGVGSYLPQRIVLNSDLPAKLDTSDEWIRSRTGIRQRHIAASDEKTSDLALRACEDALSRAGIDKDKLDAIVLATTTPDNTFPATATRLQAKLGITRSIPCYDVQAVCAGFVFALNNAWNMLRVGQARCILVVGAEIYSRSILDWNDRSTCVLFGDGAGAFVLEAQDGQEAQEEALDSDAEALDSAGDADADAEAVGNSTSAPFDASDILDVMIATDGRFYDMLYIDGGAGSSSDVGRLRMNGSVVFREGIEKMSSSVIELLARNDLDISDISLLVPHQANQRIMDGVARRLGLDSDRVVSTVGEHGNISAATIPTALASACAAGRVKRGDLIAITAMGGGFAWGGALIRW